MPLIFYTRPKYEFVACDSITYINGKESDLRNGFIKSYQQIFVNLNIDFRHSKDAY